MSKKIKTFLVSSIGILGITGFCRHGRFFLDIRLIELLSIVATIYIGSVVAKSLGHINAAYGKHVDLLCQVFDRFEGLAQSFVARTDNTIRPTQGKITDSPQYPLFLTAQKDFSRYIGTLDKISESYPEIQETVAKLKNYAKSLHDSSMKAMDAKDKKEQDLNIRRMQTTLEQIGDDIVVSKANLFNKDFVH